MFKFLTLAAAMLVAAFSAAPAVADNADPAHYHVGEVQPFKGLVCGSQVSAMHIFNTWMEVDVFAAKRVFIVYQNAEECKFLTGYNALFIEKIISSIAAGFDGELDHVLVFSISPSVGSAIVDFLVTWENVRVPATPA